MMRVLAVAVAVASSPSSIAAYETTMCEVPEEAVLASDATGEFNQTLHRNLCVRVSWSEPGELQVIGTYEQPEPDTFDPLSHPVTPSPSEAE